jgi:hypothetical protein
MSGILSVGGAGNVGGGSFYNYSIDQSLRFNDDDSAYLSWTPASAGNRKTWTWSCWVKRSSIDSTNAYILFDASTSDTAAALIEFGKSTEGDNSLNVVSYQGSHNIRLRTSMKFRDVSSWYHIVVAMDTTQATDSDRVNIYVNGTLQTDFQIETYPAQNHEPYFNSTNQHHISKWWDSRRFFDGYMAEVNFIDGTALDATSFGETSNGVWVPKSYSGSYGTNGFYLPFAGDVISEGFNTVTYTGNGGTQSISGLGFEPDFVWIKKRSASGSHQLFDTIRGATNRLNTNNTNTEASFANTLQSFDADGFTVGSDGDTGGSGQTYVAWCWDAGTGSSASNTDGSITSTVKANTDYGFSIATWTGNQTAGATVGHGLSQAPEMYIVKARGTAASWAVYHSALGATKWLLVNSDQAATTSAQEWNDTEPTSTVVSLGSSSANSNQSATYVGYFFHSVSGYSKIGSYTGNGTTSNSITGLGFKPAFLMIKNASASSAWYIFDNTRNTDDVADKYLRPNLSNAEGTLEFCEFTDDGFDITSSAAEWNGSGNTIIYMAFADTRDNAFWKDVSGQGNNWTPNNLDYRDELPDSPTNNFPVLIPGYNQTTEEGGLKLTRISSANNHTGCFSSMGVSSGKWYVEIKYEDASIDTVSFGVAETKPGYDPTADRTAYAATSGISANTHNEFATWIVSGRLSSSYAGTLGSVGSYGSALTSGDIVQIALDMDNQKIWYGVNGTYISSGDPANGTNASQSGSAFAPTGEVVFVSSAYMGRVFSVFFNFGQDSTFAGATTAGGNSDENGYGDFKYSVPSGFLALCSANLPEPAIGPNSTTTSDEHFDTVLYTAATSNGTYTHGNLSFQPDFSWLKNRNVSGEKHFLADVVRGNQSITDKWLNSNATNAEGANGVSGVTFSTTSTGYEFVVTNITGGEIYYNGRTYVGWNWKAGGTAVSNTDGSITTSVSTNTDAGISIIKYTGNGTNGATIGHNLGVTPDHIIIKRTSSTEAWVNWHKGFTATQYLRLYLTNAVDTATTLFNSTLPSSSVITLGTGGFVNTSSENYICYAFAEKEGFSKFGTYTGNGNADGTFVYTGFRPAWVMVKRTDSTGSWVVQDTQRDPYNQANNTLLPNSNSTELTYLGMDYLSNGFKVRNTDGGYNTSNGSYIYLAFAEAPAKYSNAR